MNIILKLVCLVCILVYEEHLARIAPFRERLNLIFACSFFEKNIGDKKKEIQSL